MKIQEELEQLSQIASANRLSELSKSDIERYSDVLCFAQAYQHFSPQQFTQVCETIRLLLLKKYTEDVDKQNAEMQASNLALQEQNVDLQRQNVKLQCFVIVLMVVTILTAAIQIFVTLKPNSQLQQQTELLKAISSQQKVAPIAPSTAARLQDNPQKKKADKEAK